MKPDNEILKEIKEYEKKSKIRPCWRLYESIGGYWNLTDDNNTDWVVIKLLTKNKTRSVNFLNANNIKFIENKEVLIK